MYKIGEVGSGVDYMYLDSSGGSWQMSKYLVNTSEGALGQTLNQLYVGKAYQVRLHPWLFRDSCGCQNLLELTFSLLSGLWGTESKAGFPAFLHVKPGFSDILS